MNTQQNSPRKGEFFKAEILSIERRRARAGRGMPIKTTKEPNMFPSLLLIAMQCPYVAVEWFLHNRRPFVLKIHRSLPDWLGPPFSTEMFPKQNGLLDRGSEGEGEREGEREHEALTALPKANFNLCNIGGEEGDVWRFLIVYSLIPAGD